MSRINIYIKKSDEELWESFVCKCSSLGRSTSGGIILLIRRFMTNERKIHKIKSEALRKIIDLHSAEEVVDNITEKYCNECFNVWPCETRKIVEGTLS